jgi:hypothetical protein
MRVKGDYSPERNDYMNTVKTNTAAAKAEQPDLVKRIGKTTYHVKVHFNPNSRETMSDKIIRMLRNEVSQMKN